MGSTFLLKEYKALGTYWNIKCEDTVVSGKVIPYLLKEISSFEAAYSRFKSDSELSRLNETKILTNPSSDLMEMLTLSLTYNTSTNNYFNIAVGGELEKLGYTGDFTFSKQGKRSIVPPLEGILTVESRNIVLNPNYNLDLGGIGKSYLIRKITEELSHTFGLKKFLINVGGDIYTSYAQPIYIQNPLNTSKYLSVINVPIGGIATSTPFLRSWEQGGKKYHHLIDPNNTSTNLSWLSCTVVTGDIIAADLWSKVILLSNANVEIPISNINVYLVNKDCEVIHLE